MKTVWRVILGVTAAAAFVPYKVKKDEETGATQVKAALWNLTYTPGADGKNTINVRLLPGLAKKDECQCEDECCCDEAEEPEEDGITIDVTEESTEPAEPAEPAHEA